MPCGIRLHAHVPRGDGEQQRRLVPEAVGPALEAVPAAEPSVAEQHLDPVRALAEQVLDVVGEDLQALSIGRETRHQLVIADAPPLRNTSTSPCAVTARVADSGTTSRAKSVASS